MDADYRGGESVLSTNKAKEMKRRASQRRATHKARLAALAVRAEALVAAVDKTETTKKKVASKGDVKSTAKARKPSKKS